MFRFVGRAPTQPAIPSTLSQFGVSVSEDRLVNRESEIIFDFYHTSDDSVNRVRKEAFHQFIRQEILHLLQQQGLMPLFVQPSSPLSSTLCQISKTKLQSRHTPIITTDLDLLRRTKDVIVIIGENHQDPGIWSWQELTSRGTLRKGSALGLLPTIEAHMSSSQSRACLDTRGCGVPAFIILNPGQILYSHKLCRAMTFASWNDRSFDTLRQSNFAVHGTENRTHGHATDFEHVATCFQHVLPQLLAAESRVHIIAIGSGCESALKVLDDRMVENGRALQNDLAAIALIEPTHDPRGLCSTALKELLRTNARSWIRCDRQTGELLWELGSTNERVERDAVRMNAGIRCHFLASDKSKEASNLQPEGADAIARGSDGGVADPAEHSDEADHTYKPDQFSCDTYSAGELGGAIESVFPQIQADVLAFIIERMT